MRHLGLGISLFSASTVLSTLLWFANAPDFSLGQSAFSMAPSKEVVINDAMRVSPVAHLARDEPEVLELAEQASVVTHNYPDAVAGAQATALTMWMAQSHTDVAVIREEIANRFEYDLSQSVDEIRPSYQFDISCAGTVPQAITCALEATDYEDAIRNAVSIGGDSDTIACITGGIAEVMFGLPGEISGASRGYLTDDLLEVVDRFDEFIPKRD